MTVSWPVDFESRTVLPAVPCGSAGKGEKCIDVLLECGSVFTGPKDWGNTNARNGARSLRGKQRMLKKSQRIRSHRATFASATCLAAAKGQKQSMDVDLGMQALQRLCRRRGWTGLQPQTWRWRTNAVLNMEKKGRGIEGLIGLRNLLAGLLSATVTRTFLAPMERVRMDILLRNSTLGPVGTARQVLTVEGLKGFWRGNGLNLIRSSPFKAINFFAYDMYSQAFLKMSGNAGPGQFERFAAGACAGLTAVISCFPLDTLRTRLLAPSGAVFCGIGHAMTSIVSREGFPSLYRGCVPAVVSMAPSSAVFYGLYDLLKWWHVSRRQYHNGLKQTCRIELGVWYTLLYGAIAGAAAEITVYPLEVVRRKMQLQAGTSIGLGVGLSGRAWFVGGMQQMGVVCRAIMKTQGIRGFYTGMALSTMQTLPNAALSYFFYETFKAMIHMQPTSPLDN